MSFNDRIDEIRAGFEPRFWVANFTEIFERVAYYGTQAVLAIYLSEQLHFSSVLTGTLLGIAGFVVYALAILAGALADRFGFRRTLMCAYLILTAGYFLLGIARNFRGWSRSAMRWATRGWFSGAAGSGAGSGMVKAVRGGNDRARVRRKCPVAWLFDLLHAGECRRRDWAADGLADSQEIGIGNSRRFSHRCGQRVPDVLGGVSSIANPNARGRRRRQSQVSSRRSRICSLCWRTCDSLRSC